MPARVVQGRHAVGRGLGTLLYGRTLYLPPSRQLSQANSIVDGLRPFRLRLHRQRAAVLLVRTLSLAALVAIVLLLLRIRGVALPLPLAPLAGAGGVCLAGLIVALLQRPAPAQMAHALDQRLGLREQLGSALEIDPADGRMAALLHQRAGKSLRDANADFVLPWPSLNHERICLIALILLVGPFALAAAHAPLPSAGAAGGAQHIAAGPRGSLAHHALHTSMVPIQLHALGSTGQTRLLAGAHVQRGLTATHLPTGRTSAAGHTLSGNALGLHVAQGPGRNGTVGNNANPAGAIGRRASQTGAGHGAVLHLTTGKNSTAGGLFSPEQQALMSLQNSISSANPLQGQSGSQNSLNPGQGNQGQSGLNPGQMGHGRQNLTGQGRQGGHGSNAGGPRTGVGAGSRNGRTAGGTRAPGLMGAGDGDPFHRFAQGNGSGDSQGLTATNPYNGAKGPGARIGNSGDITLNGSAGPGGRMILTMGLPNQGLSFAGGSLYGAPSTNPLVTVPGYVAPDSNTVSPDERSAVQGYFSPPPSSG